jgi:hypothetical protein
MANKPGSGRDRSLSEESKESCDSIEDIFKGSSKVNTAITLLDALAMPAPPTPTSSIMTEGSSDTMKKKRRFNFKLPVASAGPMPIVSLFLSGSQCETLNANDHAL